MIELLVTMSVMAILMAVAIPSFQSFVSTNRVAALTNDLVSALNLARSEAVKRGARVTVCKTANPAAVAPTCSTGASWQTGWLVFVDGGAAGTIDGADVLLRVGQPSSGNAVIAPDANFANYASYLASGVSQGNGGTASGNLAICLDHLARTISVNTTGRIRTFAGAC